MHLLFFVDTQHIYVNIHSKLLTVIFSIVIKVHRFASYINDIIMMMTVTTAATAVRRQVQKPDQQEGNKEGWAAGPTALTHEYTYTAKCVQSWE